MSLENPIYKKRTYCNPMSLPNCPQGDDGAWLDTMDYTNEPETDYRSISDPSVMFYDNKWYLYPSYDMAYVSEDFVTWKYNSVTPKKMGYSPSVIPHRGKFLMTSHSHGLYISDSPVGPFEFLGNFQFADGSEYTLKNGHKCQPIDSALFRDDDGRIYIYFFDMRTNEENGELVCQTYGVELDGDNPVRFCTEPYLIHEFNGDHYWERYGQYNQNNKFGWVEGQWMLKHNGRYYMIYSSSGTMFRSYCMAAYYSDEGPLTGFVCQKNNPITVSNSTIVNGAGHGCIEHGPDNSLWAFYTVAMSSCHPFERRIGIDPIGVDENGELYCPGVTDTPQFGLGEAENPLKDNSTGLLPLSFIQRHHVKSSSCAAGRSTHYAFDESLITWWQPADDDKEPTLYVDLESDYVCEATRIIWRDINLDYKNGIVPGAYKYIVEGRKTVGEGEWETILDMSENSEDYNIDYKAFPPVISREIRLRILGAPKGITPAVISFTIFGTKN